MSKCHRIYRKTDIAFCKSRTFCSSKAFTHYQNAIKCCEDGLKTNSILYITLILAFKRVYFLCLYGGHNCLYLGNLVSFSFSDVLLRQGHGEWYSSSIYCTGSLIQYIVFYYHKVCSNDNKLIRLNHP
jgi:hypothetical protein